MTSNYNWDCYSTLRCGYETLKRMGLDVDLFFQLEDPRQLNYDQIWLMSTAYYLTDTQYQQTKGKVVSFGLSEPCKVHPEKYKNCDVYCTNDFCVSKALGYYWFPTSCDARYHKKLNLDKVNDVVFIGLGQHPVVKNRIQIVRQLRDEGISVKVFGAAWPKHPDNCGEVRGENLIMEINKARLMLDISTESSPLPRRIFEGLCCGTTVLTHNRSDVQKLFDVGKEILTYASLEDLVEKVKTIVGNHQLLEQVGQNGRERCLRDHDITCRIKSLVRYLKTLGIGA